MNIEEERKAFEAWFDGLVPLKRIGDTYTLMSAHTSWRVWQARAALSHERGDELTAAYLSGAADVRKEMKRVPLTEAQLLNLMPTIQSAWSISDMCIWYARAIERAHGIGGTE